MCLVSSCKDLLDPFTRSFHLYFANNLIDVILFFHGLGDIIGSFLAKSEVILVILDVDLDNCLKFGKKFANTFCKIGSSS